MITPTTHNYIHTVASNFWDNFLSFITVVVNNLEAWIDQNPVLYAVFWAILISMITIALLSFLKSLM